MVKLKIFKVNCRHCKDCRSPANRSSVFIRRSTAASRHVEITGWLANEAAVKSAWRLSLAPNIARFRDLFRRAVYHQDRESSDPRDLARRRTGPGARKGFGPAFLSPDSRDVKLLGLKVA
jgi:hypothetical protein